MTTEAESDDMINSDTKQSIRIVVETMTVALLIWVGSAVMELKISSAVIQAQLATMTSTTQTVQTLDKNQSLILNRVGNLEGDVKDIKVKQSQVYPR